ncbi:MAG TPA: LysR substrate-binding domain-containing protein [Acidimicrobiia bacterium]|nr:LysR substrate-binding domain-containing protein [Acidimicrobiia bacterium]
MELRHLDALLAIDEEGSFTAAADALATVQSNVSEQVRQLEDELGAELLVRSRRGARPTECGQVVLDRARRIRRELDAMRTDVAAVLGLEIGDATFGIVGTASRWVVPPLVAGLRQRSPGIRLRIQEAASERLVQEVVDGDLAQAVVTEPVTHPRIRAQTLLEEALVAVVPVGADLPDSPVPLGSVLALGLILPPAENPLRHEVESAAAQQGLEVVVTVEVEGIRLIADLVASGAGASILPRTALPPKLDDVRTVVISGVPPRRLALVTSRDAQLSLADEAVRESVLGVVADRLNLAGLGEVPR